MDFALDASQLELQTLARKVANDALAPRAAAYDREQRFPAEQMADLARHGFLTMLVPSEAGGNGRGSVAYALAMMEMAGACAATSVTMAVTNMVGDAIYAWGSASLQQKYIPRLNDGSLVAGAFALSEPGAGSDASSLKATAVRQGDRYVLNGSKCWITSGDQAKVMLVMAKTNPEAGAKGISAFLVEPSMPGFSVGRHEEKMGIRASSTVTINLEDVEVPAENRVGDEGVGFKIAMRALDGGRIGIGAQAVGIGLAAQRAALAYVNDRPEVAARGSVRTRLAQMSTELEAARLLVMRAADMKDRGVPFTKEASMAKMFATESANRATHRALEIVGPDALDARLVVERLFRDVRVSMIYEGTSEVQRVVIARKVLAES
ncbi:MAG: acyl-CoA dehydrogenase family protein [Myxococcota bacterium]